MAGFKPNMSQYFKKEDGQKNKTGFGDFQKPFEFYQ